MLSNASDRSRSYDSYIDIVQSMQNVIHHIEQGSFSTVSWPTGWLGSREEVVSIEVCWELRFFCFFFQWPLRKKKKRLQMGRQFFKLFGSRYGFFRSGFTRASLKTEGKTPVCRDWLMTAVTAGSSWYKHSQRGTWEASLVNMLNGRIAKSCFWRTAVTQVQKV